MSDPITVRDHSLPCKYAALWPHWTEVAKAKWWQEPECLGGKKMVLLKVEDGLWRQLDTDESDSG